MDTSNLTSHQRQIRQNIRNLFLVADVREMQAALPNYKDDFSKSCIQEMIDTCKKQGVHNFGETV